VKATCSTCMVTHSMWLEEEQKRSHFHFPQPRTRYQFLQEEELKLDFWRTIQVNTGYLYFMSKMSNLQFYRLLDVARSARRSLGPRLECFNSRWRNLEFACHPARFSKMRQLEGPRLFPCLELTQLCIIISSSIKK